MSEVAMAPSNNNTIMKFEDCEEDDVTFDEETNNGWSWKGTGFNGKVRIENDGELVDRLCYGSMVHNNANMEIREKDCVLVAAADNHKPFVAKVAKLFENPEDGEMMVSLLWYYRQGDIEGLDEGEGNEEDEVFASKHWDVVSVECLEDRCFVMTFDEFCRYQKMVRMEEAGIQVKRIVPELGWKNYPRTRFVPKRSISPDRVFMCRKVYDFKRKTILKLKSKMFQNSSFSTKYLNHNKCDKN